MKQITGRLENWVKGHVAHGTFLVWGDLHDDTKKRWEGGAYIHTSNIKDREIKEGDIVETMNSTYLLGKPKVIKLLNEQEQKLRDKLYASPV